MKKYTELSIDLKQR